VSWRGRRGVGRGKAEGAKDASRRLVGRGSEFGGRGFRVASGFSMWRRGMPSALAMELRLIAPTRPLILKGLRPFYPRRTWLGIGRSARQLQGWVGTSRELVRVAPSTPRGESAGTDRNERRTTSCVGPLLRARWRPAWDWMEAGRRGDRRLVWWLGVVPTNVVTGARWGRPHRCHRVVAADCNR
jgi:hypothetical protein